MVCGFCDLVAIATGGSILPRDTTAVPVRVPIINIVSLIVLCICVGIGYHPMLQVGQSLDAVIVQLRATGTFDGTNYDTFFGTEFDNIVESALVAGYSMMGWFAIIGGVLAIAHVRTAWRGSNRWTR